VFPYLAMLLAPSSLALMAIRRTTFLLLLVGLLYWLMVGFRFQVGMDWNNYLLIYDYWHQQSLGTVLVAREPGYGLLMWASGQLGGQMVLVNAVSGLVFTWGLFAVAKRWPEPFIAIIIATPLLVVAFAMSATRQAMAAGPIFYLMATWSRRSTVSRVALVLLASTFHFSAIFVLTFVALASRAPAVLRIGGAIIVAAIVLLVIRVAPESMEAYSRLYVGSAAQLTAPGALVQTGAVATAALVYFLQRPAWIAVHGENELYHYMAWAALLSIPAILISSVGAYRLVLYLWPMAMYYYSGFPSTIPAAIGRAFYRILIVFASFAMLIGWLQFANNSVPWIPYKNWLLQHEGVRLFRHAPFKRQ